MRNFVAVLPLLIGGPLWGQSTPIAEIPVGNGPIGIELTEDGRQAVVPLLFPESDNDPNLVVIDLVRNRVDQRFRVGRRLIDAEPVAKSAVAKGGAAGFFALTAFGDQDFTTLVDLENGASVNTFPVGSRPAGVSTIVAPDGTAMAIAANGSSGDVTIFDISDAKGTAMTIPVGKDPRDAKLLPSGEIAYVALGGENQLAVVDVQSQQVVKKVPVGNNPITLAISPNLQRAVVSNLTNNTITVLNTQNPRNPTIRRTPTQSLQLAVGVQPSSIAITPDGSTAFVANAGSSFVSVVDLNTVEMKGILPIQRSGASVSSAVSAARVSKDGNSLIITERGNDALMLIYDLVTLNLNPPVEVDIPGEPRADILLTTDEAFACPGFYRSAFELIEGSSPGLFNAELLLTSGRLLLQGGLNLGAAFGDAGAQPGFVAFNIANSNNEKQRVDIDLSGSRLVEGSGNYRIRIDIVRRRGNEIETVLSPITRQPPFSTTVELDPGFYVARVRSPGNGVAGTFAMALETRFLDRPGGGFQGGVNIGGLLQQNPDGSVTRGFASFCISEGQLVRLATSGQISLGPAGAGPMKVTIRDRDQALVREISNSPPPAPEVAFPPRPSLGGAVPTIFVDDNAGPNGDGSSSRPFRSITEAIGKAAVAGDIIRVRPGTYSPSRTGEVLPIGGPGPGLNRIPNRVRLIGAGADRTIIDAESMKTPSGENLNAILIGGNHVQVSGFTVRNASAAGIFVNGGVGVFIERNFLTGNVRFGIGSNNARGILIERNTVVANDETGIAVAGGTELNSEQHRYTPPGGCSSSFSSCVISNTANEHRADGILVSQGGLHQIIANFAYNNGVSGIEANNGVQPGQPNFPTLTTRIINNVTIGNGGVQLAFAGTGILVTEGARATDVRGNTVTNNRPGGIAVFEDAFANIIRLNTIRDNAQNGLVVQKRSQVNSIRDNQILNNGLTGIFIDDDASVGVISTNEIVDNGFCLDCSSAKAGIALLGGSSIATVGENNGAGNAVGFEVNNGSTIELMQGANFDASILSGGLIRGDSQVTMMRNVRVSTTLSENPALRVSDSIVGLENATIMANNGDGLAIQANSGGSIADSQILTNAGDGIAVRDGSALDVSRTDLLDNGGNGVFAAGNNTEVSVTGGRIRRNGNRGVNASSGSTIACSNVSIGANANGNRFGDTPGC